MNAECAWCDKAGKYYQDYPDGISNFFGQLIRTTHIGRVYACDNDRKHLVSPQQAKADIKALYQYQSLAG